MIILIANLLLFLLLDDQRISRDEFAILVKVSQDPGETNYLNNFKASDSNHDGLVTAVELKGRLAKANLNFSLSTIQSEIGLQDQNNDGKLNYNGNSKLIQIYKAWRDW